MKKPGQKPNYSRIRGDTGHHQRILLVMVVLGVGMFLPIAAQLYTLMIRDFDYYSNLALRNQVRTTSVTANRGEILDRNMNVLATSVGVENVYLDPHELKQSGADIADISQQLGKLLERDPQWIRDQAV